MGRHPLPLEQCYGDRALLWRSGDAVCLPGMGVSQRRYGYDPFLDDEKKGRLVQLLSRILLLWRDVLIHLLPTHLFPGCERRLPNLEWDLSSSKYLEPDSVLGLVWFSRYVRHPLANSFRRYRKHGLTGTSVKDRLLPALGCFWRCLDLSRVRPDINPNANFINWGLDRLSDSKRGWPWLWTSDSKVLLLIGRTVLPLTVYTPQPIVAVQNNVSPAKLSVGMAVLIFTQTFGGSLFLAFSQTAFTSSLGQALKTFAPDVDVRTLLIAGASTIREVVPQGSLNGVLLAYNQALNHVFYITAGAASASFVFCWGMGFKNVKKVKKVTPEA